MKSFNNWCKLKKCKDFNKKLSLYEWGPIDKDLKPIKGFKNYHTISPAKLHEIKRGTCWDYVEAQREWYDEQNIPHKVYYLEGDNKEKASHTILIAKIDEFMWDEASWKEHKGLHFSKSEQQLIREICEKHSQSNSDISKIVVYEYPKPNFGMGINEFMSWVKEKGDYILTWKKSK